MTFGLITSFIITFTLLPTLLNFAPTKNISLKKEQDSKITAFLALVSLNNKNTIFGITGLVIILSVLGISKLEVENSFINYFNKNTEIYKGMKLIDDELGGTTPLEVILKFPKNEEEEVSSENDEFDDIQLSNEALAAVAGGQSADEVLSVIGHGGVVLAWRTGDQHSALSAQRCGPRCECATFCPGAFRQIWGPVRARNLDACCGDG